MADTMDPRPFAEGEDRLPWLETVEPDEPQGTPVGRVIAWALVGLAVLAGIVFGIWKLQQPRTGGDGTLIEAQAGPYKVLPTDPGGLKVKGEGDSAVATSQGKTNSGAIDLAAVPEAPVAGRRVVPGATPAPEGGRNAVSQVPQSGGRLVAAAPVKAQRAAAPVAGGGSLVQLGAFPTEAAANQAWDRFSKRFGYVAALGKAVQPVAANGRTLYRLRVNAGSANQAADICGRLKVAGESCFIAS